MSDKAFSCRKSGISVVKGLETEADEAYINLLDHRRLKNKIPSPPQPVDERMVLLGNNAYSRVFAMKEFRGRFPWEINFRRRSL